LYPVKFSIIPIVYYKLWLVQIGCQRVQGCQVVRGCRGVL